MKFWKLNGAGNDFIIINNIEEQISEDKFSYIARTLCKRRLSIGADGLMVLEKPDSTGDFKMLFFNSDGSQGEMCGNGARCICRYGYENNLAGQTQRIETVAGLVTGERIDNRLYKVKLNNPGIVKLDMPVKAWEDTYACSYVELGNPGIPHAVVHIPGLKGVTEDNLLALGRKLRYHDIFPKGANINFYDFAEDSIYERTYERGVEDFTLACGTGTGSLAAVLTLKGIVPGEDTRVVMPGGELTVDVVKSGEEIKEIYLTGDTNIVAKGEVLDESLDSLR